jgi:uncharacterized protein (UPF0303 family)
MTGRELLDELEAQERRIVFDRFDEETAWALGVTLREAALSAGAPVSISVRRNGQRLFHAALAGASADNDGWLDRKCAVVDRYGRSSCAESAASAPSRCPASPSSRITGSSSRP